MVKKKLFKLDLVILNVSLVRILHPISVMNVQEKIELFHHFVVVNKDLLICIIISKTLIVYLYTVWHILILQIGYGNINMKMDNLY